jgi:hypothetical protein
VNEVGSLGEGGLELRRVTPHRRCHGLLPVGLHWMDPISGRDFFCVEKVIQWPPPRRMRISIEMMTEDHFAHPGISSFILIREFLSPHKKGPQSASYPGHGSREGIRARKKR